MIFFTKTTKVCTMLFMAFLLAANSMAQSFPFPSSSRTGGTPAIVEFNNKLVMVFIDRSSGRIILRESVNGTSWGPQLAVETALPGQGHFLGFTSGGIGAVEHNGKLYISFVGERNINPGLVSWLFVMVYDVNYNVAGGFFEFPGSAVFSGFNINAPSFGTKGSQLHLQVGVVNDAGTRVRRTFSVAANGFLTTVSNDAGFSLDRSAIANFGGNLYMFAERTDGLIEVRVAGSQKLTGDASLQESTKGGFGWTVAGIIPGSSNSSRGALSAITHNGQLYLLESGSLASSNGFVNLRTTSTPNNVNSYSSPSLIVSPVGSNATAATIFGGNLYIAYKNENNDQITYQIVGQAAPALTTPFNLSAAHQPANNRVLLSWSDSNGDETGFTVQRAVNNGTFTDIGNPNSTGSNLSFPDPNITVGNSYRYRVRARRGSEVSGFSNIAAVTITQTVNAPSSLSATVLSSSRIRLNWNDNSNNETQFRIQRAFGNGNFQTIKNVNANITTHTDINLNVNTLYRYRVFAVNGSVVSASSNIVSARTLNAAPNAPTNFAATFNPVTIAVDFAWTENSNNETGFEIEFKLQSQTVWVPLQIAIPANATTASTSVTNVLGGNTYDVRVRAVNAIGTSAWSNIDSVFLPFNPLPVAPSNLTAIYNSSSNTINLAWNDNSNNELGFTIEFSVSGSQWSEIVGQPGANVTTKQISNPPCCFIYSFRIRSRNNAGTSLWSNTATVLAAGSARGTGETKQAITKSDVKAYPNPFTDVLNISYPESAGSGATVTITSAVSGKVMRTISAKNIESGGDSNSITWDGRGDSGELLKPGTYLYQLKTNKGVITGRVLLKR